MPFLLVSHLSSTPCSAPACPLVFKSTFCLLSSYSPLLYLSLPNSYLSFKTGFEITSSEKISQIYPHTYKPNLLPDLYDLNILLVVGHSGKIDEWQHSLLLTTPNGRKVLLRVPFWVIPKTGWQQTGTIGGQLYMVSEVELVWVRHLPGIGNLNNSTSPRNKSSSTGIKYLVVRYVNIITQEY